MNILSSTALAATIMLSATLASQAQTTPSPDAARPYSAQVQTGRSVAIDNANGENNRAGRYSFTWGAVQLYSPGEAAQTR